MSATPTASLAMAIANHPDLDSLVGQALATDPYLAAENSTGRSYKDDPATLALGSYLLRDHSRAKREILRAAGDTYHGISYTEFVAVIERFGFEEQLTREFAYETATDRSLPIKLCVYTHPDGLVMKFTTWPDGDGGETINNGDVFYNWQRSDEYVAAQQEAQRLAQAAKKARDEGDGERAHELDEQAAVTLPPHVTSTSRPFNSDPSTPQYIANPDYDPSYEYGGSNYDPSIPYDDPRRAREVPNPRFSWSQMVVVGSHSVREGLLYNLRQLKAHGHFVTPWLDAPHGATTFDLAENERYYGERHYPSIEQRPAHERLSKRKQRRETKRHRALALELLRADVARWPQEMKRIIGPQALAELIADDEAHLASDR